MFGDQQTDVETLRAQLMAWKQGIPSEASFWNKWMEQRGGEWPEDFRRRFDPETPLDPWIATAAQGLGKREVSILDVGSGPLPAIGYQLEGVELHITAVDPLASVYKDLMDHHGLKPPIAPKFASAEELSSFFEPNSFDIIHCRNALDHSFDPLRGINEMLKVVRVGGLILLRHHRNEAEQEAYRGFHHHNFDCKESRFIIWSKSTQADVGELLKGRAEIACAARDLVEVAMRKIADVPETTAASRGRLRQYLEAFVEAATGH